MKTLNILACFLVLATVAGEAQTVDNTPVADPTSAVTVPASTPYQVVDIGPHHRVWQWQTFEAMPDGEIVTNTHSYRELGSGLNYSDPATGAWTAADPTIEAFSDGAIGRHTQHKIIFASNLNSPGAIDVQLPDGNRLTSNVLGLMFSDPSTGQAVQIAKLQDSQGEIVAANEVFYPDAFDGISAGVLYWNRLDGVEQDIVINAQLPSPESFGLNSATTYLCVFTEFFNPPTAVIDSATNSVDGEVDQSVRWGATSLGRGKAFLWGNDTNAAPVLKRYTTTDTGRVFLLEKVRFQDVEGALAELPAQASNVRHLPKMASTHFKYPDGPSTKSAGHPMHLALGKEPGKGYVLDYTTLATAYTNYCFQSGGAYYVSSALNLSGTNTFEGGVVIKFAANASIAGTAGSQFKFLSGPYRPVVFTAKDDNTLADAISGSTGTPSGYYANPALNLSSMSGVALSDFRICYANRGISAAGGTPVLSDAQFVNCGTAVSDITGALSLKNALLSNIKTNFNVSSSANTISVQNATLNNSFDLVNGNFSSTGIHLTNCIFVNVTNLAGSPTGGYNGFYCAPTFGSSAITNTCYPLQTVGSASCYLTNGCSFLNAGTTNVDPNALLLIQAGTTYPPYVFSNATITIPTNLWPQAQRDNVGNPSPGYHYYPLDWIFGASIAKSNVTFSAGTAAGFFYNSSGGTYGLAMGDSAVATFNGTATAPCRWARQWTVQEGGNGLWTATSYLGGMTGQSYTYSAPSIQAQFTDFYELAAGGNLFRDNYTLLATGAKNCEFYIGGFGGYDASLNLTNCLIFDAGAGIFYNYGANNLNLQNCTVYRGSVRGNNGSSNPWPLVIVNSAFDSTIFYLTASGNTNGYRTDYNSFLLLSNQAPFTVNSNTTPYFGGHEVFVTNNYNWQTSWFGSFYQSTNSTLINKGSTTADRVGLYQFTTQTNQVKETNSIVDLGYHYVATDAYGNPLDSNGDGIPDYLEDANGNGLVDSGEIGWNITGDLGLYVIISKPRNGSSVP